MQALTKSVISEQKAIDDMLPAPELPNQWAPPEVNAIDVYMAPPPLITVVGIAVIGAVVSKVKFCLMV